MGQILHVYDTKNNKHKMHFKIIRITVADTHTKNMKGGKQHTPLQQKCVLLYFHRKEKQMKFMYHSYT